VKAGSEPATSPKATNESQKLKQIAFITSLLIVPYLVALVADGDVEWAGRFGLALVFAFTGFGHFAKTDAMAEMLPESIPGRRALILASGIFELLLAMLLLAWPKSQLLGITIIGFLIVVFPANVSAAVRRIPFGGHSAGPVYLLVRAPVQLLLILWTYWFMVRGEG
jgi:uncharacterized membrane protein